MPILTTTILSAFPHADTVALALVELGPRSVRTLAVDTLASADAATPDLISAAAARLTGGRTVSEIVVVAPAEWCATREIGISPSDWRSTRAGVMESLEDLVPVASEDAMVGLLGLHDADESCTRGAIVVARREQVEPVLAALRSAAPGAHETVVSSTMAALGLGLSAEPAVRVVEPGGVADSSLVLRYGLPSALDAPPAPGELSRRIGEDIPATALATAAVAARRAAPASYAPLLGRPARRWTRYALPAGLVAAAALMIAASPLVWNSRLDAGAENARVERVGLRDAFDAAQRTRTEAERYAALCGAFDDATSGWHSVVPTLRDAIGALEDSGHLYRLSYDSKRVVLTGESADPGAVLERLESAGTLSGARSTTPMTPSPTDPSLRVFTFSAEEAPR